MTNMSAPSEIISAVQGDVTAFLREAFPHAEQQELTKLCDMIAAWTATNMLAKIYKHISPENSNGLLVNALQMIARDAALHYAHDKFPAAKDGMLNTASGKPII